MTSCFFPRSAARLLAGLAVATALMACVSGCMGWRSGFASPPTPLGSTVEPFLQKQEEAGESHDFVIYDHEFYEDTARLTRDGEDHLRQIAARAARVPFPIIVEQSKTTPKPGTKNEFPVYHNPELDMQRLQVVARGLAMMGVPNAHARVVIAPALAPGFTEFEGERAYSQGIGGGGFGGGGFGGGGFGGGGFGGGGFGGGGGFF
jgi:hypothetical protein